MMEKAVRILELTRDCSIREDLAYWLRRSPEERVAAVELLRRQYHGNSARLQRSARVVRQERS